MKVHSLTILHYGKDYLSYALRSVYHSVDQLHIFYTPTPSHGHSTSSPPIETKEELMKAAYTYDPDNKIRWYDIIGVAHEGMQRDIALKSVEAAGAELVVVLDCDEVWPEKTLGRALRQTWNNGLLYQGGPRNCLVNMIHFWRSFNWVCYDQNWPVRIIDLRYQDGINYVSKDLAQVYHFGYATTNQVMEYKIQIHGHKNEFRENWLNKNWLNYIPDTPAWDCHPTNSEGFWNAEKFDKDQLPDFMKSHLFYHLEIIR